MSHQDIQGVTIIMSI